MSLAQQIQLGFDQWLTSGLTININRRYGFAGVLVDVLGVTPDEIKPLLDEDGYFLANFGTFAIDDGRVTYFTDPRVVEDEWDSSTWATIPPSLKRLYRRHWKEEAVAYRLIINWLTGESIDDINLLRKELSEVAQ